MLFFLDFNGPGLEDPQKPKNKQTKYFFGKKWLFCYYLSYPHLIFLILKILALIWPIFWP